MLTVACVFRATDSENPMGGYYNATWVQKLKRNVERHLSIPHRFVCLTNSKVPGLRCIPLQYPSWEGWWSKIELFAPGRFEGHVLYLDLDVFATGSLDDFVTPRKNLVMLRDHLEHVKNSSIMFWNGKDSKMHRVYYKFMANPEKAKAEHLHVDSLGDQGFIADTLEEMGCKIELWQDILGPEGFFPFSISRMINLELRGGVLPPQARIVYCLGVPKFHQYDHLPFIQEHWT